MSNSTITETAEAVLAVWFGVGFSYDEMRPLMDALQTAIEDESEVTDRFQQHIEQLTNILRDKCDSSVRMIQVRCRIDECEHVCLWDVVDGPSDRAICHSCQVRLDV